MNTNNEESRKGDRVMSMEMWLTMSIPPPEDTEDTEAEEKDD